MDSQPSQRQRPAAPLALKTRQAKGMPMATLNCGAGRGREGSGHGRAEQEGPKPPCALAAGKPGRCALGRAPAAQHPPA